MVRRRSALPVGCKVDWGVKVVVATVRHEHIMTLSSIGIFMQYVHGDTDQPIGGYIGERRRNCGAGM